MLDAERLAAFRARFPVLPAIDDEWRRKIAANPLDGDLRLVYGDWLIERGDPMGELIVVQCRLDEAPDDQLRLREEELLRKVVVRDGRWRSLRGWAIHELEALGASSCVVRRGFVERIQIDAARLVEQADRLFALAPLRALCVTHAEARHVEQLARLLWLRQIVELDVRAAPKVVLGERAVEAIASELDGLTALALRGGAIESSSLPALCRMSGLRTLSIVEQPLRAVTPLARSALLPALESLALRSCELDEDAILELTAARMDRLAALDLAHNQVGARGGRALAGAHLPGLVRLDLSGGGVTPKALEAIAGLPALRELVLGAQRLPDATKRRLAGLVR